MTIYTVPPIILKRRKEDLRDYFPGETVIIDARFAEYLGWSGRTISTPTLSVALISTLRPENADQVYRAVIRKMPSGEYLSAAYGHAVLAFLGSKAGLGLLAIPEGMDEINLIIGYMRKGQQTFVLYVEHEFEDGQREIHLHARPVDQWDDDLPYALIIVDEYT